MITVGMDSPFKTIMSGVKEAERRILNGSSEESIFIRNGIYKERVTLNLPHIRLIGEGPSTIITGNLYALLPSDDIGKLGTFRTATFMILADDIVIKNMTVENSSGAGKNTGQAIAMYCEGDRIYMENVTLLGYQDTLFTGPLPEKEREKDGFTGPSKLLERKMERMMFKNCRIEGDIDFIFGSATAVFENCLIFQRDRTKGNMLSQSEKENFLNARAMGYMCAPSTYEKASFGYIFLSCRFISDCPDRSCFLARPWRDSARCAVLYSYIGPQIKSEGFSGWDDLPFSENTEFLEYKNYGPGAERIPLHSRELSECEALNFSKKNVLKDFNFEGFDFGKIQL